MHSWLNAPRLNRRLREVLFIWFLMLDWVLRKQSWKCLFYNSNSIQENVNSQTLKKHSCEWNSFLVSRQTFLSWTDTAIVIHSPLSSGWGSSPSAPLLKSNIWSESILKLNRVCHNFWAGCRLECQLVTQGRGPCWRWLIDTLWPAFPDTHGVPVDSALALSGSSVLFKQL